MRCMDDPPSQATCDSDTCPAAVLRGALPRHHRHDQMCWLSRNFSFNLSAALRGAYAELKIYPNGAAKSRLVDAVVPDLPDLGAGTTDLTRERP